MNVSIITLYFVYGRVQMDSLWGILMDFKHNHLHSLLCLLQLLKPGGL